MKTLLAKIYGISTALLNFYLPILKQLFASGMASLLPFALEIGSRCAQVGISSF
jgi:hypothetical protein